MSDADLKDGYRRLQEQQRRKLERVKELRQAKQDERLRQSESLELSSRAFGGVSDDLQLHTAAPGPSSAAAGEVQDLRDRVRSLDDENARVKKLLAEKDFEVGQLRKKLSSQRQRPPTHGGENGVEGLVSGDAAAARVMELSRKVRELTAEAASEKNKAAAAQRRCKELEAKMEAAAPQAPQTPASKPLDHNEREEFETEVRRLRERLADTRSQLQTTSRELKIARKALSDETGLQDNTSLHEILSGQSNWRGRQQQIITLERQVKDLKRQLAAVQQPQDLADIAAPELVTSNGATTIGRELLSHTASTASASTFRSSATGLSMASGGPQGRTHAALLRMQKERREKAEAELREKKELETETKELRKKLESVRSRNQTLSTEAKAMRTQVETLLKKGRHDDELIESMTRREKSLREMLDQNEVAKARLESSQRHTMEQVSQQKVQESQILARMREIVQDKEAIIQAKEEQIERLQGLLGGAEGKPEPEEEEEADEQEPEEAEPPPRPPTSNGEAPETDARPPRGKSSASQKPPSARPASSRASARSGATTPTSQRPPSRPGSAASSRSLSSARRPADGLDGVEAEDLRTRLRAAEVERDRLRELLLLQDGRYQSELAARGRAEQELAGLRRRSTNLERQAGGSVAPSADLTDVERLVSAEELPVTRDTVRQLQEALAMTHEEVATRKQALKSALEAKQQDVKWLMEIMEKTREVYLSGIQRVKAQRT